MMSSTSIYVAVRPRPLLAHEISTTTDVLKFFPDRPKAIGVNKVIFGVDHVFKTDASNELVYNTLVEKRLEYLFNGFNLAIFAYGQTGSGKTFTMGTNYSNDSNMKTAVQNHFTHSFDLAQFDAGIIPRCLDDLFRCIEERKEIFDIKVTVSFIELYNENIIDLLNEEKNPKPCEIREDKTGFKALNLTEKTICSANEALDTLERGSFNRKTAATAMNVVSSRSHAIFCIAIEQTHRVSLVITRSKLQMIDLAGSERAGRSETTGERLKEGISINKELFALGNVITALVEKKPHIPYRGSKLTRLLSDSIGGNSHTVMIACISPAEKSANETINTLRYATDARKIKNEPIINCEVDPEVEVKKLKKEVEKLKEKLAELQCIGRTGSSLAKEQEIYEELNGSNDFELKKKNSLTTQKLLETEENYSKLFERIELLEIEIRSCASKVSVAAANENVSEVIMLMDHLVKQCLEMKDLKKIPVEASELLSVNEVSADSTSEPSVESTELIFDSEICEEGFQSNQQLQAIEKTLSDQQEHLKNLENMTELLQCTQVFQEPVEVLKKRIENLQAEKDKLATEVEVTAKAREESQQRIKECEREIKNLQDKVQKSNYFIKMKGDHEKKVAELETGIQKLKQTRVAIMKQMKLETTSLRKLNTEKEREVARLKVKDRRKEVEIARMKNNFERQINVVRKRMERALSANKKLADAQKLKKNYAKSDEITLSPTCKSPVEVKDWILHEVDIEACHKIAQAQIKAAKESMNALKIKICEEKDSKKFQDLQKSLKFEEEKVSKLKELPNPERKSREDLWSCIVTLSDAKSAVEALFNKLVASEVENDKNEESHQHEIENKNNLLNVLSDQISMLKTQVCELEKDKEDLKEKIASLENNQRNLLSEKERESLELQDALARAEKAHSELDFWQKQALTFKKGKKGQLMVDISAKSKSADFSEVDMVDEYLSETAEESFVDDKNDPDWRLTPMQKRKRTRAFANDAESLEEVENPDVPRKKFHPACNCSGECKNMKCSCRKKERNCSSLCKCNKEICINLESSSVVS